MDVACAWRGIEDEVVQFTPVSVSNKLFQCAASHTATPQGCRLRIDTETEIEDLKEQAKEAGIKGYTKMTEEELKEALKENKEEEKDEK